MASWQLALDLRDGGEQPIFIRLARAISDDVRRGRLKPGDALPGSRTLARALGVHRNTVLAAYAELAAEGWISAEAAARTFVSHALPDVEAAAAGGGRRPRSASTWARPAIGETPARRAARKSSRRACWRCRAASPTYACCRRRRWPAPIGVRSSDTDRRCSATATRAATPGCATALAGMLSALRGVPADDESLMVTRGSQLALDLVARALLWAR